MNMNGKFDRKLCLRLNKKKSPQLLLYLKLLISLMFKRWIQSFIFEDLSLFLQKQSHSNEAYQVSQTRASLGAGKSLQATHHYEFKIYV